MRNIGFSQKAFKDLHAWAIRDKKTFDRIHDLILESARDPFKGKGKPEPLKHQFKGFWSRRISDEHRLVYAIDEHQILIISCEGHYTV